MKVEISNGELIDKVSVLKVKLEKIQDQDKCEKISIELMELEDEVNTIGCDEELLRLIEINRELWDVIGEAKYLMDNDKLNERFIELSAETIRLNNARFLIKKYINSKTKSKFEEVKEGL